jgi:CheY-like chemotaxis protein
MLASLGHQVMAAADGEEALAVYRAHQQEINLILCDQWMPRLDGWQLLTALRTINPSVPVIMISGAASNLTEHSAHTVLPNASLKKPYGMDVLQQTIQQVLSHG